MSPVSVQLSIRVRVWREGRLWVADCPALGVVSQAGSQRAAKRAFEEALQASLETSRDLGTLDELLRHAAAHPESLWESVPKAELTDVRLEMPLTDFMAARGQAVRQSV